MACHMRASVRSNTLVFLTFQRNIRDLKIQSNPASQPQRLFISPHSQCKGASALRHCAAKRSATKQCRIAACCRASQHVAAHRGVLPPIAACCRPARHVAARRGTLPPVAARCRQSRHAAAQRGTLPPIAACRRASRPRGLVRAKCRKRRHQGAKPLRQNAARPRCAERPRAAMRRHHEALKCGKRRKADAP